jgi:tRNA-2-methylthio-N6-dimethylallyladenosine synthase
MFSKKDNLKDLPRKVFIKTYGCQMNVYDSERMAYLLQREEYQLTADMGEADIILLNTCSIREKPEHKIYSILGRLKGLKDKNPDLILGVGGCVAQQEGEKLLEKSPCLDLVFGTHAMGKLPSLLDTIRAQGGKVCEVEMSTHGCLDEGTYTASAHKVSSYVSVIRGCNNFCSYCVVPYVRGRERSRPQAGIIAEVEHLVRMGVKEVTLLGQNVNSYGNDCGRIGAFPRLLTSINGVADLERIRFITSHPKDLSDALIRCFKELDKLCEHIHLPVQSGSNKILKLMNRGYTREDYLEKIDALRTTCPEIGITSDVIVGFPQETDEDFEDTLNLMKEVCFDDLFSFNYSDRPMTPARELADKVPSDLKGERLRLLQEMQREYSLKKNRLLLNRVEDVLIEGISKKDSQRVTGKTRSNKTVNTVGGAALRGEVVPVRIREVHLHSLSGELEDIPVGERSASGRVGCER